MLVSFIVKSCTIFAIVHIVKKTKINKRGLVWPFFENRIESNAPNRGNDKSL